MDKVYAFIYNPCIHESAWATVSLHKTKKGAEMAMEFHRNEARKEHEELYKDEKEIPEFGEFENWAIIEKEIKK